MSLVRQYGRLVAMSWLLLFVATISIIQLSPVKSKESGSWGEVEDVVEFELEEESELTTKLFDFGSIDAMSECDLLDRNFFRQNKFEKHNEAEPKSPPFKIYLKIGQLKIPTLA